MTTQKAISTLAVVVLLMGSAVRAGEWHVGPSLQCGQCHAEHASVGGQPIPGGPFSTLLLKGSVNEMCLSCHDGTDPTAPDVMAPVSMYGDAPSTEGAAGFFITTGVVNPSGHTLDVTSLVPLNSAGKSLKLSCASCHDYHGNTNYRNLKYDPAGAGDSISLSAEKDVFWQFAPTDPPTPAGSIAAYNRSNIGYKSGWARWCGSCHDQIAANAIGTPPAHFNGHPVEVSMSSAAGAPHASSGSWLSGSREGFLGNAEVAGEGIPRLPFLQPIATDFAATQQVQGSNMVFCGSCHKSHGSEHNKDLRWPFVEGGTNYISGCQQCHNK
jgi:hypothetical protein